MSDLQLVRAYAMHDSDEAFSKIATRHADWIYSAALRMVRDDCLAEDVTQAVFIVLAKKAAALTSGRRPIAGWLFKVTRYSAANAIRARSRRERHERLAASMNNESRAMDSQDFWQKLAPDLDELVSRLRTQDKEAILLRFYQRKNMAAVAAAFGVSEEAAKKRVARAIEKLRALLSRKGYGVPGTAVMTPLLLTNATHSAPVGTVAVCAAAPGMPATAAAMGIAKGAIHMMVKTQVQIASLATIITIGLPVAIGVAQLINTRAKESISSTQPVANQISAQVQGLAASATRPQVEARLVIQQRVKCAAHLKAIGNALLFFADQHQGHFPNDLGELQDFTDITFESFLCPATGKTVPDLSKMNRQQIADWVNRNTDYVYIPGWTSKMPSEMSIVYEKDGNENGDGMNILFGDGHVEFTILADAQMEIAASLNSPLRAK